MSDFTNLQNSVVEGMLTQAEIDLITEVINEVLKPWKLIKKTGTFILAGQERGKDAQEILRFNLPGGRRIVDAKSTFGRLYSHTSDRAAESAIDELLLYPQKQLSCDYTPNPAYFGRLSSDIYYLGESKAYAIVINATYGRFLASVSTERIDLDIQILQGVALSIERLTNTDKIMLESINCLTDKGKAFDERIRAFLDLRMANYNPVSMRNFFE